MKRIIMALALLPLSSFAMKENNGALGYVSLTRDGEGDRKGVSFSMEKEVNEKFSMFSRDLKSHYQYTVALSLLKLSKDQATIKGYVSRELVTVEKDAVAAFRETIKIDEKTIPVNMREVIKLKYAADMAKNEDGKIEAYPVNLGLVVLNLPKAKL